MKGVINKMADIRKLKYDDKDIYPITHIEAIVDDNEEFIKDKYVTATKFEGTNNFIVPSLMPEEIRDLNARVGAVADDIQSNTLGTLIDKVGDLNNLQTSNKANAVSSINEVISNSESLQVSINTKLDKTIYNNKIATLTQNLESVNTATNNVKQRIVDTLKNNSINASNTEGFDSLINKVQSMNGKSSIQYGLPKFINIYNYWTALASIGKTSILDSLIEHIMIEHNNIIHIFGGGYYDIDPSNPSNYDYNYNYKHYGFDVNTGTLTTISTNERCFEKNNAVIYNNSIYVYGSYNTKNDATWRNGMFAYDINTRSWSTKKSVTSDLYHQTMEIVNNKIYIIGGYYYDKDNEKYIADNIKIYDPALNSFTNKINNLNFYDHATTVIGNNIYLFGGQDMADNNLITAYKYSTTQNKLTQLANLPTPLFGHFAIDFDNKYIYLIGGGSSEVETAAEFTYRYDIEKNNYSVYESGSFKYPYVFGKAIRKNKMIYACGGIQWLSDNYIYTYPGIAWAVVDTNIEGVNAPSGTESPSVEPLTIMSNKYYKGTTQFRTYGTAVSYSYESGLTMKPSTSTYHIWAALNTAIDVTDYTNAKLTFQCGTKGVHKFMIGANTSSGSSGNGTSTPTFNSGTSEVKSTTTYGTSAYYAVNIDISNLTGTKYLTVVACYDQSTVNYSNGIYITDLILE
jgi:hypothetical protein